jgi:hypothetical protein
MAGSLELQDVPSPPQHLGTVNEPDRYGDFFRGVIRRSLDPIGYIAQLEQSSGGKWPSMLNDRLDVPIVLLHDEGDGRLSLLELASSRLFAEQKQKDLQQVPRELRC